MTAPRGDGVGGPARLRPKTRDRSTTPGRSRCIGRAIGLLAAFVLAMLGLTPAPPAYAGADEITRLTIDAVVDPSGLITVTQTMDARIAQGEHGITLAFLTRANHDKEHDLRFTHTIVSVTSPTGAPTTVTTSTALQSLLVVTIGDPGKTVTGLQTYVLTYTIAGAIQPGADMDKLLWRVVDSNWKVPISDTTVTIHGPADVSDIACTVKHTPPVPCTSASHSGPAATFTQDTLSYTDLEVDVGWPAGTFPGATLDLVPRLSTFNEIRRLDLDATLDAAGRLSVTQTWDFAYTSYMSDPPAIILSTTVGPYDTHRATVVSYRDVGVTRPDGTAVPYSLTRTYDGSLMLTIADPGVAPADVRTYVIRYVATGLVVPTPDGAGTFTWDMLRCPNTLTPDVTARLHAPAVPTAASCGLRQSPGPNDKPPSCDTSRDGQTTTFTVLGFADWQWSYRVAGSWPSGTFPDAIPHLRATGHNPFDLTYGGQRHALAAVGAALVGCAALWWWQRRQRARWAAGIGPAAARLEAGDKDIPVRFTPPEGMPIRLAEVALTGVTDRTAVSATLVDLAARGYLTMEPVYTTFHFHRADKDPSGLDYFEATLLSAMFSKKDDVSAAKLSASGFATTVGKLVGGLRHESAGWFSRAAVARADVTRSVGAAVATVLPLAALVLGGVLAARSVLGVGWWALPFVVIGLGLIWVGRHAPTQTAEGVRVATELRGFRKFLVTAQAEQLRWEADHDVFSQYLPWAMALGCADQWTSAFEAAPENAATMWRTAADELVED